MNLKELKEIIDIFTSKDSIDELEVEKSGVRLRIKRSSGHGTPASASVHSASAAVAPALSPPAPEQAPEETDDVFHIKAPIVGTFYKSPSPTTDPFVSVGDFVEKGTVLCIIEAMKLMNEIESDVSGEVTAVFVENGQPVEYGGEAFCNSATLNRLVSPSLSPSLKGAA